MAELTSASIPVAEAPAFKNFASKRLPGATMISIASFPEEVQDALKHFDTDGDGSINVNELGAAALQYKNLQKRNSELSILVGRLIIGFIVVFIIAFGTVFAASFAVVRATATLQATTNSLTSISTGATLRTAGGSSSVAVKPVGTRRELEAPHARHLLAALDFVSTSGDDLIHTRRPARYVTATWDAHGRALQKFDPTLYQTVGTTDSSSAEQMCLFFDEGQTSISIKINVSPAGIVGTTINSYVVTTTTLALYGCSDANTNGYGFQGLLNATFFDSGSPYTVLLVDCPKFTRPASTLSTCSISVPA